MYPSRPAPAPPASLGSAPPYEPFPTLSVSSISTSASANELYLGSEWNESTSTLTSFTIPRERESTWYPPAYVPIATSSPSSPASPASQRSDRTQNTWSTASTLTRVPSPFPFSAQASSPRTQRKPRGEPLLDQPLTATMQHATYHLGHPTARPTARKSQTLPLSVPRPGHSELSTTTFMQVPSDYAFLQHRPKQTLLADLETIAGRKLRSPILDKMLGPRKEKEGSKVAGGKLRKEKRQSWEDEWIDGHEKVLAWQASSPRKNNWI